MRSPILGYNHNILYRGLVFHVQTEDSGVANPHLFTHLFHGGVILHSRKLEYDPEADEAVIKALMQAQHKAVMKELKRGSFSDKINEYLGDNPDLLPSPTGEDSKEKEHTGPFQRVNLAEAVLAEEEASDVALALDAAQVPGVPQTIAETESTAHIHAAAPPSAPPPPGVAPQRVGTYAKHRGSRSDEIATGPDQAETDRFARPETPAAAAAPADPAAAPTPSRRRHSQSGDVVVSRPAVIVGAPPKIVGGRAPSPSRRAESSSRRIPTARRVGTKPSDSLFGQGLISEKSLDEVILAYLSDDSSED